MKRMTDFDKYWEVLSQNRSAVSFQLCVKYLGFDKLTGAKTKGWQQKGWSEPFSFYSGANYVGSRQVAGGRQAGGCSSIEPIYMQLEWDLVWQVLGLCSRWWIDNLQQRLKKEESRQSRKARMETLSDWNLKQQVLGLAGGGWWQV